MAMNAMSASIAHELRQPLAAMMANSDAALLWLAYVGVYGAAFLVQAHRMWSRTRGTEDLSVIRPMVLFHASNLYLSLLFVAVALDPLVTR